MTEKKEKNVLHCRRKEEIKPGNNTRAGTKDTLTFCQLERKSEFIVKFVLSAASMRAFFVLTLTESNTVIGFAICYVL